MLARRSVVPFVLVALAGSTVLGAISCGGDDAAPETPLDGSGASDGASSGNDGAGGQDGAAGTDGNASTDSQPSNDGQPGPFPLKSLLGAGQDAACALAASPGALRCWGSGAAASPRAIAAGSSFRSVDSGRTETCAVRDPDGKLFCWPSISTAPIEKDARAFAMVDYGEVHACAIATNGGLHCWGNNQFYSLGTGTPGFYSQLLAVGTDTDWMTVSGGGAHTCAIKTSGALYCWGYNADNQVGDGAGGSDGGPILVTSPKAIQPGTKFRDVSAGGSGTCAVRADGALLCWGVGAAPQGGTTKVPTQAGTDATWVRVRVESTHSCGIKANGTMHCWGTNVFGERGDPGINIPYAVPQQVGSDTDWVDVAVGDFFSCGAKAGGGVKCWGANGFGALGDGKGLHWSPSPVGASGEWASVSARSGRTCGVKKSGALACWGALATILPGGAPRAQVPVAVGTATTWSSVHVGSGHQCVSRNDGTAFCWGTNSNGQTGTGMASFAAVPTTTNLVTASLSLGTSHTCAIGADSFLSCWGDGSNGRLGFAPAGGTAYAPAKVGTDTWLAAGASDTSGCFVRSDGTLWCAGKDFNAPMEQVSAETTWTRVAGTSGTDVFYGIKAGALYTWTGSSSPAQVGTSSAWKTISADNFNFCGLHTDNSLHCGGDNTYGARGDGTASQVGTTVQVGAALDWQDVSVGNGSVCGLRNGGDLACWGNNLFGVVGDGTAWATSPIAVLP